MSSPASVVCNSGPLITLAKLNLLHLLNELYGRVYFSRSIYNEAVVEGMRQGYEDAGTLFMFLNQMGWLPEKVELGDTSAELRDVRLDQGERDTLALAIAKGSTLILMDEAEGRRVARALGLKVRGSLGILIEAFRRDLISSDQLRLNLTEIARRQDIWVNPALVERLLAEVLLTQNQQS